MDTAGTKERDLRSHWMLDPSVVFLNHGSFGACPKAILQHQSELRARLESEPVRFFMREAEPLLDAALAALGQFIGAQGEDLAFVPNATSGVNTVLRSLTFEPGDELIATDHGYNACNNALGFVAERAGAKVVLAKVPFPLSSSEEIVQAVLAKVTPRTRIVLVDHVTSATGLVFPLQKLVRALEAQGIDTLVDGAHAPGMLPLDVTAIGAAYYTGNCHKWLCAPKGAAFLHVRKDRQARIRPLSISHGANATRADRSRFRLEFDWVGTVDPTAALCIPECIRYLGSLFEGGWPELFAYNRRRTLAARDGLVATLGISPPAPDDTLATLASVPVPPATAPTASAGPFDPLQDHLWEQARIELPVWSWPAPPQRLLRVSCQLYNRAEDYTRLSQALREALAAGK